MEPTINATEPRKKGAGPDIAHIPPRLYRSGTSRFSTSHGAPLAECSSKAPANLVVTKGWEGLDLREVRTLLQSSFGKTLSPGYFEDPAETVIVHQDYTGIAVIKRIGGVAYLDKYAVAPEERGNGLGKEIWGKMTDMYPSVMWRAHKQNPVNRWYETHSDGSRETEKWIVFWCGAIRPEKIEKMIETISAREPSFIQ